MLESKYGDPAISMNGASEPDQEPEPTEEELAEKKKTLAYLKALSESSQSYTKKFMAGFEDAWGYVQGEKRYPAPGNQAAKEQAKHLSRTVRNGMFQMIDHTVSYITDAEPKVIMKTLQEISEIDRRKLESVLESILEELDWEQGGLEVCWDAEVGSVGMSMFYTKVDELTGQIKIFSKTVDPSRVGVNRQATSFKDARYVTYKEDVSLAEIRERWPETGHKVKAKTAKPCNAGDDAEVYSEKTDDELVTMPGNEFIVSKDGAVVDQEATITWAWEVRTETREVWEDATNNGPATGFYCPECHESFIDEDPMCPFCEEQELEVEAEPVDMPEGTTAKKKFRRQQYPHGRCIIGIPEQEIILYEGPNELPLQRVFPFAGYWCYKKSRSFYGQGTYHILKSNSKARDQNISLLRDHLRYNAHPIMEHPSEAEIYATIGIAPGTRAPVDSELCNLAHFIDGGKFDYQGFMALEQALDRDAKEQSGVDEILTGGGPAPESGEAQKTRITAKSKRIGGKLKRFNQYKTDYAAIAWELASRLYTEPRTFVVRGQSNELSAITETIASLPYDVIVQVTADPDKVETDRLMGQNLGQFIMSKAIFDPMLLPFMDDILIGFGLDPARAETIQQKLNAFHQQQIQAQQAQAEMMEAAGMDMPPQEEMPPQEGAPQQMEGAMQ